MMGFLFSAALSFATKGCFVSSGERTKLLNLNYRDFDQSPPAGGWRKFKRPGCDSVAIGLLKDYLARHDATLAVADRAVMNFHVGQMHADEGRYPEAIMYMKSSLDDKVERQYPYWNKFVAATIAFLQDDGAKIAKIKSDLIAAGEDDPGYLEIVSNFQKCLRRPYKDVGACADRTAGTADSPSPAAK